MVINGKEPLGEDCDFNDCPVMILIWDEIRDEEGKYAWYWK